MSPKELGKYLVYVLKDELLYYKGRLCIPKNTNCKLKILYDRHNILILRHSGFQKTYITIKHSFSWPGMKRDIREYVEICYPYQISKIEQTKFSNMPRQNFANFLPFKKISNQN
jgi:hypothetical protein